MPGSLLTKQTTVSLNNPGNYSARRKNSSAHKLVAVKNAIQEENSSSDSSSDSLRISPSSRGSKRNKIASFDKNPLEPLPKTRMLTRKPTP